MINLEKKNGKVIIAQKMAKGDKGGYYFPEVDEGILTWQKSDSDMPDAPNANIQGPPGLQGESGVYVGENEPDDANVWILPSGLPSLIMTKEEIEAYIDKALWEVENSAY